MFCFYKEYLLWVFILYFFHFFFLFQRLISGSYPCIDRLFDFTPPAVWPLVFLREKCTHFPGDKRERNSLTCHPSIRSQTGRAADRIIKWGPTQPPPQTHSTTAPTLFSRSPHKFPSINSPNPIHQTFRKLLSD